MAICRHRSNKNNELGDLKNELFDAKKKNGGATEVRALHRHVSFHVLLKFGRV